MRIAGEIFAGLGEWVEYGGNQVRVIFEHNLESIAEYGTVQSQLAMMYIEVSTMPNIEVGDTVTTAARREYEVLQLSYSDGEVASYLVQ